MKLIIFSILLMLHLHILTTQGRFIINRTGEQISINYFKSGNTPLFSTGAIVLSGSSDHTKDQMIVIPDNASNATVAIGNTTVTISSFPSGTSYVITTGSTPGTFIANSGLITYDTATGTATPGNPSPVTPGSGF